MPGKEIATVVITVDLGCCYSRKKIKCALCKLQKRYCITSVVFDEKKNTITVSGAFNAYCFFKEIYCLAYKVIINIVIIIVPPTPPPPPPPPAPLKVDVNLSVSMCCCCQPCSCYQPHQGCYGVYLGHLRG